MSSNSKVKFHLFFNFSFVMTSVIHYFDTLQCELLVRVFSMLGLYFWYSCLPLTHMLIHLLGLDN
jgi:hypothetical protein